MRIDRNKLLDALQPLKPALAGERDVIEAQRHIWFDGDYAYAHSNSFGVRSVLATGFVCSTPGKTVLKLLDDATADTVELELDGASLVMRTGRSVIKLPSMSKKQRVPFYAAPKDEPVATLSVSAELLAGLKSVLILKPSKARRLEHRGVCIFSAPHGYDLYTTDSQTLMLSEIDEPFALKRTVLIRAFAEQVAKQCDTGGRIEFYKDHIQVKATETVTLFASVLDTRNLLDLPSYADRCCDPEVAPSFRIPAGFDAVLEHAVTLAGSTVEPAVTLRTSGHLLKVSAEFNGGFIDEEFDVDRALPNRRVRVLLAKPLKKMKADRLMIGPETVAWRGKHSFLFLPSH